MLLFGELARSCRILLKYQTTLSLADVWLSISTLASCLSCTIGPRPLYQAMTSGQSHRVMSWFDKYDLPTALSMALV